MRSEGISNLNDNPLTIYDLDWVMEQQWSDGPLEEIACVTSPYIRKCITRLVRKYRPDDRRDPSQELAYIRSLTARWGTMNFHEIDNLPSGTIYFVRESDYPGWKEAIDKTVALLTNVGPFSE